MTNKIYIIIGHYGSGKSEFSVNFAYKLKKENMDVCLADLDIVNPYFRSREVRTELNSHGIEVISDTMNSRKGLDMPYLSPAIKGRIVHNDTNLILDCGGDDVGVKVLKQFYDEIKIRDYEMYMMINTFRPQTSSVDRIITMKNNLEKESNLKITGYINNSNYLRSTTVDDMINSDRLIKEVSSITSVPVIYVSGIKEIINKLPDFISGERFIMDLFLRDSWL